ncbi:MAG: CTP synthase [Clostridiales bacterium]|jgi:CTP synthase|nr:CTP synthase [Clostridiales bacterium]
MSKHIFITGGVASGIGKGITSASLGRLLKSRNLKVVAQKLDPYLNADPGLLNPLEHGEVFVLDDGTEADLDLGHYERFIDENLTSFSTTTSGKVYCDMLIAEKTGKFNGITIQVIPHVTDETKKIVYDCAKKSKADVVITEIGGTVGDLESQAFIEAARQISIEKPNDCLFIHVSLVPFLKLSSEYKTKPTQHSVKMLQSMGIRPDIIVTRSDEKMDQVSLDKISKFCYVQKDCVVQNYNVNHLYEIPLILHNGGLDSVVVRQLKLKCSAPNLTEWQRVVDSIKTLDGAVNVALVGKYVALQDSYLSEVEALSHAGFACGKKIRIKWVDSNTLNEENASVLLGDCAGVLVPGAFGSRGIDGLIVACKYAREHNIPYLGLSMGMQVACIEFAKNVCGLKNATSTEFEKDTKVPVVHLMSNLNVRTKDGSMRIGAYDCTLLKDSKISKLYQSLDISERHRNRYEINFDFIKTLTDSGLTISGRSVIGSFVESIENPACDFFIAVQYHPQFKSRPNRAHPLFKGFVEAMMGKPFNN